MRIVELRLQAFGPFSGLELPLAGPDVPRDALHVVFGPNEAGKSTTLRAILGLLFGIPAQTRDAHAHRPADLRIGAVLEAEDGTRLEVVRRKGAKSTLLDPEGRALDEAVLQRLCGSTSEAMFRAVSALDHVTLREGGEALLRGGGDVGESLFDAALGASGRGIHAVLKQIEGEAREIFVPRGKKALNEALRVASDARRLVRDRSGSGEAWVAQEQGLAEARARREAMAEAVRAQRQELARLERRRRLLPRVATWRHLDGQLRGLGEVVLLPPEASEQRRAALQECSQAEAELARLDGSLAQLAARLERLVVPAWLDAPTESRLSGLRDRAGAARKAAEDRPRLSGGLATLEQEASLLAEDLPSAGGGLRRALPDASTRERVRELALREQAVHQRERDARDALASLGRRRDAAEKALAALPPARDAKHLRAALRRLERDGDLVAEIAELLAREQQATRQLGALLAPLRPRLGPEQAATLPTLPVPESDTVARHAEDWRALAERESRLGTERNALEDRARANAAELARVHGRDDLPDEAALRAARAERDRLFAELRRPGTDRADADRLAAEFERAQARADEIADRLWREAERVARAAVLAREARDIEAERRLLATRHEDLRSLRREATESWRGLWSTAAIEPEPPEAMRTWLLQVAKAREQALAAATAAAERERLERRAADAARDLEAALGPHDGPRGLRTLAAAAEAEAERSEQQAGERAALARDLAALEEDLARQREAHEQADAALAAWRAQWAAAVAVLGLPADASAAQATAALDATSRLAAKRGEVAALGRRIESIDRDLEAFADLVRDLAREVAPRAQALPAPEAAAELMALLEGAQATRTDREHCARELADREAERRSADARRAEAERRVGALLAAARIPLGPGKSVAPEALVGLEAAEARSQQATELRARRAEVEAQILETAEGLTLAEACAEVEGTGSEELASRRDATREQLERLEDELQRLHHTVGAQEEGLRLLEQGARGEAADLAAEAQSALARVRALAEDWARLRLAGVLLTRSLEHYRDRHQGPVIERAGALFGSLTRGAYSGLRADFDEQDKPVLRCLRAGGQGVAVDALSDGTRDQLYLALRLASLERQARSSEPLPLVLDDVLVHFDDDRAAAALEALADHARLRQVLLFTHHAKVVELARGTLDAARLHVVELRAGVVK